MAKQSYRYPVTATCIKTGAQYHWPSINSAADGTGYTFNAIKLCISGQCDKYAGMIWTTTAPLRNPGPSPKIAATAELHLKGYTAQQIADELGISLNTAKYNKQRAKHLGLIKLRPIKRLD